VNNYALSLQLQDGEQLTIGRDYQRKDNFLPLGCVYEKMPFWIIFLSEICIYSYVTEQSA